MIINAINKLIEISSKIDNVNHIKFGNIEEYDNNANSMYPFINLDIVNSEVKSTKHNHIIRVYILDRNNTVIAYNKAELIITDIMELLEIDEYKINYFNIDFKDEVSGVYADIQIDGYLSSNCDSYNEFVIDGFKEINEFEYIRI